MLATVHLPDLAKATASSSEVVRSFCERKREQSPLTMTSSLRLYPRIASTLDEFLPHLHRYRKRNLAWMIVGIHQAQHVHLSKIADYRPGEAMLTSKTMQLRRFLANEAVDPGRYYHPVARHLLAQAAGHHKHLRLLLDVVELSGERKILMLALAYRRRALPLLWHVWRGTGTTSAAKQIAFLTDFEALLVGLFPDRTRPIVVADGEFHAVALMRYLDGMDWGFRLRLPCDTLVHLNDGRIYALSELAPAPGQRRYLQGVYLTGEHAYGPISIAVYWKEGEDAPWFIVTDEEVATYQTLVTYSRRMWTRELFADLEGGGFHLHQSRLYEPERLSRLLLAVCLVYLWLMQVGAYVVKRGLRFLVDRTDRRDRSLAEIGRHWVRRRMTNGEIPRMGLVPYF
jgi:hypothetical protein